MTVVPVNVQAVKQEEQTRSRQRWKTPSGWKFPGMKPAIDCSVHPLKPDPARIDELKLVGNIFIFCYSDSKFRISEAKILFRVGLRGIHSWSSYSEVFAFE